MKPTMCLHYNQRSYKHDWKGTFFQLRCEKCKETVFAGCDYLDSTKAAAFLVKQKARKDCPCPPKMSMELTGQFTMKGVLE